MQYRLISLVIAVGLVPPVLAGLWQLNERSISPVVVFLCCTCALAILLSWLDRRGKRMDQGEKLPGPLFWILWLFVAMVVLMLAAIALVVLCSGAFY